MTVHVGIRVRHLAVFFQNVGHDFINRVDHLEEFVVRHVFQRKFTLARVSGVGLAQDGVTVARDHLFRVQRVPSKFGNGFRVHRFAFGLELVLELLDPFQDFLVGEAVERTGQRVQSGSVRQERITQGRTDQVRGVRRRVAALVVRVDAQVQTHELIKRRIVVAEHPAKVSRKIQRRILTHNSVVVDVAINRGGNFWQLGDDGKNVFQGVLVV
mmetsp:Transcript_34804/g.90849  ORF Transcript_34804/g.90849 Transcript_34804/m.90849 type:complete len:213 (+) Transcript_34804:168-806(+)